MACFLVPTAEAVVMSGVRYLVGRRERRTAEAAAPTEVDGASGSASKDAAPDGAAISWHDKLGWLTTMLWGGAFLLFLEHVWHGEVVFRPPFLVAKADPASLATMLHEMATVGVGMAVLVTAVWAVMVLVVDHVPALARRLSAGRAR